MANLPAEFLPERTPCIFRTSRAEVTGFAGLFVSAIGAKVRLSGFGRHGPGPSFSARVGGRNASLRRSNAAKTKTPIVPSS